RGMPAALASCACDIPRASRSSRTFSARLVATSSLITGRVWRESGTGVCEASPGWHGSTDGRQAAGGGGGDALKSASRQQKTGPVNRLTLRRGDGDRRDRGRGRAHAG